MLPVSGRRAVWCLDRSFQIVQHQRLGHAAEVDKRVLHTTQEVIRRLPVYRLAVPPSRVGQDDTEDVHSPFAPHGIDDENAAAEVDLGRFARSL